LPELNQGVSVLCDRFVFSNLAYQGLSLPMEKVLVYNRAALDTLIPDLTIFIDVPPEICLKRIQSGRGNTELFEDGVKLKAVRENFLRAFDMLPDAELRFIDGNRPPEIVFGEVWEVVKPWVEL
jgi:dTMP kinase